MDLQGALPGLDFSDEDEYDKESYLNKPRKVKFSKTDDKNDFYERLENGNKDEPVSDTEIEFENEEVEDEHDENKFDDDDEADEANPLLDDLVSANKAEKKSMNTDLWFSRVIMKWNLFFKMKWINISSKLKDSFDFLRDNNEENDELLKCIELEEKLNQQNDDKQNNKKRKKSEKVKAKEEEEEDDLDEIENKAKKIKKSLKDSSKFEEVPMGKIKHFLI